MGSDSLSFSPGNHIVDLTRLGARDLPNLVLRRNYIRKQATGEAGKYDLLT